MFVMFINSHQNRAHKFIETDTTAQQLFWPSLRSISPLCTTCVDNDFWISGIVGILSE